MLQRGDAVPHFEVTTSQGRVRYRDVWQQQNLVLVALPQGADAGRYADAVSALSDAFRGEATVLVTTFERIEDVSAPAVLIADRWGEIAIASYALDVPSLPPPPELLEWVRYLQHRCPECEGEAR